MRSSIVSRLGLLSAMASVFLAGIWFGSGGHSPAPTETAAPAGAPSASQSGAPAAFPSRNNPAPAEQAARRAPAPSLDPASLQALASDEMQARVREETARFEAGNREYLRRELRLSAEESEEVLGLQRKFEKDLSRVMASGKSADDPETLRRTEQISDAYLQALDGRIGAEKRQQYFEFQAQDAARMEKFLAENVPLAPPHDL